MLEPASALRKVVPSLPCAALRPREAAAALGVSERTLWTWMHQGDVPHVRRGKTVLYRVESLRRWLEDQAAAQSMKDRPDEKRPGRESK